MSTATLFDGATLAPADTPRLAAQLQRVYDVMRGGGWWTPAQLEEATGDNWASVSARLRDCRKPKFGGHTVERVAVGGGLFRYRLVVRKEVTAGE